MYLMVTLNVFIEISKHIESLMDLKYLEWYDYKYLYIHLVIFNWFRISRMQFIFHFKM